MITIKPTHIRWSASAMAAVYIGSFLSALLHFAHMEHTLDPQSGLPVPKASHAGGLAKTPLVQDPVESLTVHHQDTHAPDHLNCRFADHLSKSSLNNLLLHSVADALPPAAKLPGSSSRDHRSYTNLYQLAPKNSPPAPSLSK